MRYIHLLFALAACSRSPAVELSDPAPVSAPTNVGAAPILAVGPGGTRAAAWVSAPNGGDDGRLYVSVDGALPVELRDPLGPIEAHGEAPPKLAFGRGGTLHALYVVGKVVPGERWPRSALRHVGSADGGRTWDAPTSVVAPAGAPGETPAGAPFGSYNFHALYAAPAGALYAAWLAADGGKSGTYVARSTDGGRTWAAPTRVSAGESCPCCRTALASGGGDTVYVAWRAVLAGPRGTVRDVVVARSADGGTTWQAPVRVHADEWVFDGCPHAGPSLQVDATGRVHVAWWTGKEGAAGVYYARSADGARTFSAPFALGVAEFSRPAHVQLALGDGGLVAAAWDDGTLRVPQVVLRLSRDGGEAFGAPQTVSAPGRAATFPVLSLSGRRVTVAWAEQSAEAAEHAAHGHPDMRDPKAAMGLPRVGENQVLTRTGSVE
jgi:hypothetical protein